MSFLLSPASEKRLIGVKQPLCEVVRWAADHCPQGWTFNVSEGVRTLARQKQLYDAGLSQTMDSFHLTGHAVDLAVIVGGKAVWKFEAYEMLNDLMQKAAKEIAIPLTWGGGWVSLKDGPHFQTDRKPV